MEIERDDLQLQSLKGIEKSESSGLRAKTSLRLKYEAESQMILKKLGGLEGIRKSLALSQRKMCQLLMVDPSSWSRWLTQESKTPPHVLRACEWYLALNDKYPGFDVNFWLHSNGKHNGLILEKTQNMHEDLRTESADLKIQIARLENQVLKLEEGIIKSQEQRSAFAPIVKNSFSFQKGIVIGISVSSILFFILKHFFLA